ncbi:MAG: hypothetical protein Q9173_006093 [Seirophora scorigena]
MAAPPPPPSYGRSTPPPQGGYYPRLRPTIAIILHQVKHIHLHLLPQASFLINPTLLHRQTNISLPPMPHIPLLHRNSSMPTTVQVPPFSLLHDTLRHRIRSSSTILKKLMLNHHPQLVT